MRKLLVLAVLVVLSVVATVATTATASNPAAIGTYTISDHGQGGWAGGPLNSDGSLGGGGSISFSYAGAQVVYLISPVSWSWVNAGDVNLCFNQIHLQGPDILSPYQCFELPVTGTPIVFYGTTLRVTLTG